ncbi:hypothetical protein EYF80_056635 [Liparis tanakae]|uniref:Uncharacterized protein n=1 Tax=Liparis tanakae TaxID=230148 RepID=A0A4Z2EX94_9TELE|nr:hypothetical protein EYF80_056635 [Liparis tanakae]
MQQYDRALYTCHMSHESKRPSYAAICQRASSNEPLSPADPAPLEEVHAPTFPGQASEPSLLPR